MNTEMIVREYNGVKIRQRADGWICLTDMAKAAGKLYADWARLRTTRVFLSTLSASMGIPILELTEVRVGGDHSGTWAHPRVAHSFAQWCSPHFAVKVTEWIEDIRTQGYAGDAMAAVLALFHTTDGIRKVLEIMLKDKEQIAEMLPKAIGYDQFLDTHGWEDMQDVLRQIGVPDQWGRQMLKEKGLIFHEIVGYRLGKPVYLWKPTAKFRLDGHAELRSVPCPDGKNRLQMFVSPTGAAKCARVLNELR